MRSAQIAISLGLLFAGSTHDLASVRGQPAGQLDPAGDAVPDPGEDIVIIEDSDKPWSRAVPLAERRAARDLFLEGNRLARIPLYVKAVDRYVDALARWKHPAFYFNLALAQLNLGREVEAHESLQHALAHGAEPLGEAQFEEAQRQLREVKRQIGQLRVTCSTPGAEVTLDGVTLFIGPGSYQGWVKARAHELTAKKAGYLSEARRVTVEPAQLHDFELRLVTLSQATDASRRWATWKPWAVVAAGAAVASTGAFFHRLAFRNFDVYDRKFQALDCASPAEAPPRPPGCSRIEARALEPRLKRADRQQLAAMGSYALGGSLVVTGVVLLYMNRPRLAEQGAARSFGRRLAVTPTALADGFGVSVSTGF